MWAANKILPEVEAQQKTEIRYSFMDFRFSDLALSSARFSRGILSWSVTTQLTTQARESGSHLEKR